MSDIDPPPQDLSLPDDVTWTELTPFQRWYYKNREEHKSRVRRRERELAEWVREVRRNSRCEECGESHIACLELHHTDENEYRMRIGNMAREGYARETIQREIERGRMLCANCHRKHHYEHGNGPWWAADRRSDS